MSTEKRDAVPNDPAAASYNRSKKKGEFVMEGAGNRQITLRDGRRLAYAEYGDPQGRPLLYFHGFPSSRLEAALTDEAAAGLGIRAIAPDRPGIGLSDFQPGRRIGDWPAAVAELADALGLGRFAVLGVSGGGPYALACAAKIPERLAAVGIVGGLGPLDKAGATRGMSLLSRFFLRLFRRAPGAGRTCFALAAQIARHYPDRLFALFTANVPAPDRQVLARPEVRNLFLAALVEAVHRGSGGGARELTLYTRPWGFDLARIAVPVDLWHGRLDATVPVVLGEDLARVLPDCRSRFLDGEGHFSLPLSRMEEILRTLVADWQGKT
jgi:pimeloyl-ACP methyl ester carboxylesterase